MRKIIFNVGVLFTLIFNYAVHAAGVSSTFYLTNNANVPLKVGTHVIAPGAKNIQVYKVKDSAKFWRHRHYDHNLAIQNEKGDVVCKVQEQIITYFAFMGVFFPFWT